MGEKYSSPREEGAAEIEPAVRQVARALIAQLLAQPIAGANAELLIAGLLEERQQDVKVPQQVSVMRPDAELTPGAREVRRIRTLLARGEQSRTVQHALNNSLTALLAEAQLLEMEPLGEEQRGAVGRIIVLARRLVDVARQLDSSSQSIRVG